MPHHDQMLSAAEAAAYYNTTTRHMRELQRHIPHYRVGGKIRYRKGDLDTYLERHRIEPAGR